MATAAKLAKQVIHNKLESQIRIAEAELDTLKARAETAKSNVEIKAILELAPKTERIQQKLNELKNSDGKQWEAAKADLESRIADLHEHVKGIESKVKAN